MDRYAKTHAVGRSRMLGFAQDTSQQIEQPLVVMILMCNLRVFNLKRIIYRIVIVMVMIDRMVGLLRRLVVMTMRYQLMRQSYRICSEQTERKDDFPGIHESQFKAIGGKSLPGVQ